nr:hypothetical protein [Tanacetum cinerariifolium]
MLYEPSVGKNDARSGQWVEITMKKIPMLISTMWTIREKTYSTSSTLLIKSCPYAAESSFETAPEITSDFKSECDIQEQLAPLPKLLGAEPNDISFDCRWCGGCGVATRMVVAWWSSYNGGEMDAMERQPWMKGRWCEDGGDGGGRAWVGWCLPRLSEISPKEMEAPESYR